MHIKMKHLKLDFNKVVSVLTTLTTNRGGKQNENNLLERRHAIRFYEE